MTATPRLPEITILCEEVALIFGQHDVSNAANARRGFKIVQLGRSESVSVDLVAQRGTRKAFRQRLHERFAETTKRIKAREAEVQKLAEAPTAAQGRGRRTAGDSARPTRDFSRSPEDLQRDLYDALKRVIVYSHERCEAMINVTITRQQRR